MAAATTGTAAENLYVVKSGDTLSRIASAHGTTVTDLKAANGLRTDRIKVGDKLKLPAAKSAPAAAPATATNPASPTSPPPGGTGNI
jgi:peptidoglycan endopeptidase LytE